MNEGSRKSTLVLGTVATVAGLAVISYLLLGRASRSSEQRPESRSVAEVLSDCYSKIHELKEQLTELHPASLAS